MIAARLSSVWQVAGVAAAALCCYLVSQSVASERAAVARIDARVADTRDDIRRLGTEIGTRGRMVQLDRWNVSALRLQAPRPGQFVADGVQLASLYGRAGQRALPLNPAAAPNDQAARTVAYQPSPVTSVPATPVAAQADVAPAPRADPPLLRTATYVRVKPAALAADPAPIEQAAFKPAPAKADAPAPKPRAAAGTRIAALLPDINLLAARENKVSRGR